MPTANSYIYCPFNCSLSIYTTLTANSDKSHCQLIYNSLPILITLAANSFIIQFITIHTTLTVNSYNAINVHLKSMKLRIALIISSTEPKLSTSDSSLDVSAVMVALLSMLNVDFAMNWL